MKVIVENVNNKMKCAKTEMTPTEFLVMHTALNHLADDETANYIDRQMAERMIHNCVYHETYLK